MANTHWADSKYNNLALLTTLSVKSIHWFEYAMPGHFSAANTA